MAGKAEVCVIIAAMDAAGTIGRAVRSALAEPEVGQVVVVDDGSRDATARAAADADDGTGRLQVERLPFNRGPAAARNHALDRARMPFVAILDSDDMILPGRFARLLACSDWDIIADNIVFVPEASFTGVDELDVPAVADSTRSLDLAGLVTGSTSRYALGRTQLGFLKPVIRRDALIGNRLRYDERLRLGEDFILYAQLLMAGARFRLVGAVGYVAVERGTSLTARHRSEDLAALLTAERELAAGVTGAARRPLARRVAETRRKWALRAFLNTKRASGLPAAAAALARTPGDWWSVVEGVALDKARAARDRLRPPPPPAGPRLLMPGPPGGRRSGG